MVLKDDQYILGLMSGTSLDGLDLAFCKFKNTQFSLIHSKTVSYSDEWKKRLNFAHLLSGAELNKLDSDLAKFFSEEILSFIKEYNIKEIDAISSHGHTVFHQPNELFTLQIAHPAYISAYTGLRVIGDFRSSDVALGGQGAPLVPIGDRDLFSEYTNRINLGGFANISYEIKEVTYAFDICPLNILLNEYALKLGFKYDENGKMARSGELLPDLLEQMNNLPYYRLDGPKSLGKEYIVETVLPILSNYSSYTYTSILRTLVEHMAIQICSSLRPGKALFTGGGVYNSFLMERISAISNDEIIEAKNEIVEFKEALIFAYLGYLRLNKKINVLGSVTGAKKDHISGGIYQP